MVKLIGLGAAAGVFACAAHGAGDRFRGIVNPNDGTFTIQGYLEDNGAPADGMYSFRVEAFEDATGVDILSELFFISQPIQVENGLFVLEVQMGGTDAGAREFWRSVGDEEMWLEIGVGEVEGGPYTTLDDRMKVGWGARAQYAGAAGGLTFPIVEVYEDELGDPLTLMSITNVLGGTILELVSGENEEDPILDIRGSSIFGLDFPTQNGAVRIDAADERVGLISAANEFAVVGLLQPGAMFPDTAILGQVANGVNATAIQATNSEANTFALLGTPDHAGDFIGDVRVSGSTDLNGSLEVDGSVRRDFGSNQYAPVGPVAYGFVNLSGTLGTATANLNVVWNAANERYEVTITGEPLSFSTHAAFVTVVDSSFPRTVTTNVIDGALNVTIWNLNASPAERIQDNFQIVIYGASASTALVNPPPAGVDPEVYYKATGQEPVIRQAPREIPEKRAVEIKAFGDR